MRLAIISDVHGNLVALDAVLADIRARGADRTVNLGDCVTSPLWPRETFERLADLRLPTVRGNHDRWLAEPPSGKLRPSVQFSHDALTAAQRAALGALPRALPIDGDVLAVHGTRESDTEYLLEEAVDGRLALVSSGELGRRLDGTIARLVLCGHSHHQHMAATAGGIVVVNPGSVGCPRAVDNEDHAMNEAGSPHARYAIATRRGARWTIEMIALEYDWTPVVARAAANGRSDWADAFLGR
jgi:predicted phosphodiesterase